MCPLGCPILQRNFFFEAAFQYVVWNMVKLMCNFYFEEKKLFMVRSFEKMVKNHKIDQYLVII